jgi:hypothetical protein
MADRRSYNRSIEQSQFSGARHRESTSSPRRTREFVPDNSVKSVTIRGIGVSRKDLGKLKNYRPPGLRRLRSNARAYRMPL